MTELNTVNAGANPDLANSLVEQALADKPQPVEPARIIPPSNNVVVLPSGYIGPDGKLRTEVEVRELTGSDEEALSKTDTLVKTWSTVLSRGVVKIGELPVNEEILDNLLIGDRDMLVLGVYKATFGNFANIDAYCIGCKEYKTVSFNLNEDLKIKTLADPINQRVFEVFGKTNRYLVTLPTGIAQKEISVDPNKTDAEIKTILLEKCIIEINDSPVISRNQVKGMSIPDRQLVVEEIAKRAPGPQFEDTEIDCPNCGGKVVVPVNLGTIFRY